VFCQASFPCCYTVPLAPVHLLHILLHSPGLENHLSLVTWCPWWRRSICSIQGLLWLPVCPDSQEVPS
jgi:hypothetical protein